METVYIGARVEPELKEILQKVAKQRGMNLSDLLRFWVKRELARLGFLSEEAKKAFGLLESEPK